MYQAEQDKFHQNSVPSGEPRLVSNTVFNEDERFVSHDMRRDKDNNLYAHDFGTHAPQRSEMVLPSIERDIHGGVNEAPPPHREVRQVNPFGSYQPPIDTGLRQLPAHSIINLDNYEESPSSKRRRIDDQQPLSSHGQARTVLVPIEQMNTRQLRYELPYEAAHIDGTRQSILDKRIVPLPPKEERARSPISHWEPQLPSREKLERLPDQVVDRVERYPQPRDHYQIPLSRSQKVDDLQFPSRAALFTPPKSSNHSSSFFDSSQYAPRHVENSDLAFPLRHNVGAIASSDRVDADSNRMSRHFQRLEAAERSVPSRVQDMSFDHKRYEGDRRVDHVTFPLSVPTSGLHRHTGPSTGALIMSIALDHVGSATYI